GAGGRSLGPSYSFSCAVTVKRAAPRNRWRRFGQFESGPVLNQRSRSYRAPEHEPSLPPFRRSHFDSKASLNTPLEERYTQMSMKLYVGNLSYETSGENLRQHFTQAGTVETATVVEDRDTGRSRGFGFVEMATKEEGEADIARSNGNDLNGRNLTVNVAKPRESRNGGRGN